MKDVTFLDKFYGEWNKVEKATVVSMSYQGLDDDKEVETVLGNKDTNNNIYNLASNVESKNEIEQHFFQDQIKDEIKRTP